VCGVAWVWWWCWCLCVAFTIPPRALFRDILAKFSIFPLESSFHFISFHFISIFFSLLPFSFSWFGFFSRNISLVVCLLPSKIGDAVCGFGLIQFSFSFFLGFILGWMVCKLYGLYQQ
jgi:hypothetical protein